MKKYLKKLSGLGFFLVNIIIGNCCYADEIDPINPLEEHGGIVYIGLSVLVVIAIAILAVSGKKEKDIENSEKKEEKIEKEDNIDN